MTTLIPTYPVDSWHRPPSIARVDSKEWGRTKSFKTINLSQKLLEDRANDLKNDKNVTEKDEERDAYAQVIILYYNYPNHNYTELQKKLHTIEGSFLLNLSRGFKPEESLKARLDIPSQLKNIDTKIEEMNLFFEENQVEEDFVNFEAKILYWLYHEFDKKIEITRRKESRDEGSQIIIMDEKPISQRKIIAQTIEKNFIDLMNFVTFRKAFRK